MECIFSVKAIAQAVGGEMINCASCESVMVSSVSTDTRTIEDGAVFVALRGENSDGHNYLKAATEKGAVCCIADKNAALPNGIPLILVENTGQALLDLSAAYRREFDIPVIAVTGSVGKTSTRAMLAGVLSQKYKVLCTDGNLNNEIGVPHTLFRLSREHQIAVIEMGMNHFGELSRITAAAKPSTAVITNVGEAHIENLGSREGILKAKLEVLEGMAHGGTVILNGDNDMLWGINGTLDYETMYFGMKNPKCDIVAENVKTYPESSEFTFKADGGERRVIIGTPGAHHIYNALTAILVGMQYNVPIDDIICGIREFVPVGMRQAMVRLGGCTLIKDCYNANPTSMRSGLEVLSLKADAKRRVACLGDMMELGTISEKAHREVGRLIPEFNVDCLITVGERAKLIAEGAKGAGMSADNIHSFENNGQLCDNIMDILEDGDVMLLKASRSMRLEEIAEFLEKKLTNR